MQELICIFLCGRRKGGGKGGRRAFWVGWLKMGKPRGAGANMAFAIFVEVAIAKSEIGKRGKTESKAEVGKALLLAGASTGKLCLVDKWLENMFR